MKLRAFFAAAAMTIASLAATAGQNAIIGAYDGSLDYYYKIAKNGSLYDVEAGSQDWSLEFLPGHLMEIQGQAGTWKKKNGLWSGDATEAFNAAIKVDSGDPAAHGALRVKKVHFVSPSSITGKVRIKTKVHQSGAVFKVKSKGTFHCDAVIAP